MPKHKWYRVVLSALLALMLTSGVSASPLVTGEPRYALVTVVSDTGTPLADAVVQLMTPGTAAFSSVRTNPLGQAKLSVPDGVSFWLRAWAADHSVVERPYVPATDGPVVTMTAPSYRGTLFGLLSDDQGLPVKGAVVSVWLDGLGQQGVTTTDGQGVYQFSGLIARDGYVLQVEAKGFQPLVQTGLVVAGGARTQSDAALVPASGLVTGELVHAVTGQPVTGATVELLLAGWGVIDRTRSDTFGYFSFSPPPWDQGGYTVRVTAPDFEVASTAAFAVPAGGWTDFSGQNQITLNPLYAEISGSVLDESGAPLTQTRVELQRTGIGTVATGLTDASGFFRFTELTGGTYRVRAVPTTDREHGASAWQTLSGGDRVTADVSANTPDRTGYGSSAIVGTVRDHRGNPIAGATVSVARGSDIQTATTDEEGRYRVSVQSNVESGVDPDTSSGYRVSVSMDGFLPTDLQETADGGPPPAYVNVQYKSTNRADFALQPATGNLAGRVLDQYGQTVRGAAVVLFKEGKGEFSRTTTDGFGRYRFSDLPVADQARYRVIVLGEQYYESSMGPNGAALDLTLLSPGGTVTQSLSVRHRGITVRGIVRAGSQRPASGAEVSLIRPADGKQWTGLASANGSYIIKVEAGPGQQYLLRAALANAASGTSSLAVDASEGLGAVANLTVAPHATVAGRVYDENGQPSAGAVVNLWQEGGNAIFMTTITDSQGNYRFEGLEPGRRYATAFLSGVNTFSALAPGEPILTPLFTPGPGETVWSELQEPSFFTDDFDLTAPVRP